MQAVFEHHSTAGNLTGFVVESDRNGGRYAVGLKVSTTGQELPYKAHGFSLVQAQERAIRWAERGGPMR